MRIGITLTIKKMKREMIVDKLKFSQLSDIIVMIQFAHFDL